MNTERSENTAVATVEPPAMRYELRSPIAKLLQSEGAIAVIKPLIPHGLDYSVVISEVYRAGVKDPKILKCTPASIVDAVSTVVQTGLIVGKTIHLVPTSVNVAPKGATKQYEDRLQAWTDYKGDIELVVRSGAARHVDGQAVYEGDRFEITLGTSPDIIHVPTLDPAKRGKLKGAYSIAYLNGSGTLRKVCWMSIADIEKVRAKSKSWNPEIIRECPEWYAIKTPIHKNCKTLPKNEKLARVIALFDRQDAMDAGELASGDGVALDPSLQIPGRVVGPHDVAVGASTDGSTDGTDDADEVALTDDEAARLGLLDEAPPAPKRSAEEEWPMPFGGAFVGKPIGDVPSADLARLLNWACKTKQTPGVADFVDRASRLLDDRRHGDATEPGQTEPGQ